MRSPRLRARCRQSPHAQPATQSGDADAERQARAVCGSCHAYPPPDILPRDSWRDEFVRMMFIREGRTPPLGPPGIVNRNVQLPPDMEQVLPFYVSHAPGASPAAGRLAAARRNAAVVHAPGDGHPRNARHAGGLARAPRRPGWRRSARRPRHRHAPGTRLQRQSRRRRAGLSRRSRAFPTRLTSRSPTSTRTACRISSSPKWASSSRPITPRGP